MSDGVRCPDPDLDHIRREEAESMRRMDREGFRVCPACGAAHTAGTFTCRRCGHRKGEAHG